MSNPPEFTPALRPIQKSALVIIGMQRAVLATAQRPAEIDFMLRRVCVLVDRARRDETQIVFVRRPAVVQEDHRLLDVLQPCFPDWIIDTSGRDVFTGTNLAAQLRAVGISQLILSGVDPEASCQQALALGFTARLAQDAYLAERTEALA